MAFEVTAEEAAGALGIGRARVYQLIESGALVAEKIGGVWFVDRQSVESRLRAAPKAGRPPLPAAEGRSVQSYTLMNRTHEILSFFYDSSTGAFVGTGEIYDARRAPIGLLSPRGKKVSARALEYWWKHRSIPETRDGVQAKLVELGYRAAYQIPFKSLGLSLSDHYWIRPEDSTVRWADINYFENDFAEMAAGRDWLAEVGFDSPDNTAEGELPKKWVCDKGKRVLAKGGSALNQEPYNEAVATALYRRLLQPFEYVPYRLGEVAGDTACFCENFVSPDEEYIPAYYIRQVRYQANHHSDYRHYVECCVGLGVGNIESLLAKMIVCDDILGNFDRHWRNFGLIRHVETLEYRAAPLFDTGNSLWCSATANRLRAKDFSFATKPFYGDANRQLRLVNDYSWFDPGALDGFADEAKGILAGNPALKERIDFIGQAIQSRIDRIIRML